VRLQVESRELSIIQNVQRLGRLRRFVWMPKPQVTGH